MEGYKTFTEAVEHASALASSWVNVSDGAEFSYGALMHLALCEDTQFPLDEDQYFVALDDGAIGLLSVEAELIIELFVPSNRKNNDKPSSKFCTSCGAPLEAGAKFCSYCGKKLLGAAVALIFLFRPLQKICSAVEISDADGEKIGNFLRRWDETAEYITEHYSPLTIGVIATILLSLFIWGKSRISAKSAVKRAAKESAKITAKRLAEEAAKKAAADTVTNTAKAAAEAAAEKSTAEKTAANTAKPAEKSAEPKQNAPKQDASKQTEPKSPSPAEDLTKAGKIPPPTEKEKYIQKLAEKYGQSPDELKKFLRVRQEANEKAARRDELIATGLDYGYKAAVGTAAISNVAVKTLSVIPGGAAVNAVYTVGKNFGAQLSEAAVNGKSLTDAAWKASSGTVVELVQDFTTGKTKIISNVAGDAFKNGFEAYIDGKDSYEVMREAALGVTSGSLKSAAGIVADKTLGAAKASLEGARKDMVKALDINEGLHDAGLISHNEYSAEFSMQAAKFFAKSEAVKQTALVTSGKTSIVSDTVDTVVGLFR